MRPGVPRVRGRQGQPPTPLASVPRVRETKRGRHCVPLPEGRVSGKEFTTDIPPDTVSCLF